MTVMGQPDHIDKQEEIDLRLTPNLRRHIFGFDVYILESTNADAPTFTYYEPAAAGLKDPLTFRAPAQ